MKTPKKTNQAFDQINKEFKRRDFLKKTGLLAGSLGSIFPATLSASGNHPGNQNQQEILYCDAMDLNYWESLFFSCYQGLINRDTARIYLNIYEREIFLNWYKKYDHLRFRKFQDPYALLEENGFDEVNGYVLIDPSAPDSINVAANYASLENLLPVTEELLKKKRLPDLKVVHDLQGTFKGVKFRDMSRLETYEWVYENQWPLASRSLISIISGAVYENGELQTDFYTANSSRDYAVSEKALFFDLSSNPAHKEEYALKDKILSEMAPHSIVWGWHVDRDTEHQHIGQMSRHGKIAVGGANIAPNFSFHSRIKISKAVDNFKNFNIKKTIRKDIEEKVYLTFAMSDGDSINHLLRNAHGAQWLSEDRGEIPFNWEMQLKLADIGPGILDYFQATAADNDYFIASASGIGYTFPSSMPSDKLRSHLYATKPYLRKTGMNSLVVLNSYQALSRDKMDVYNEALGSDITGIMQGYTRAPATEHLYGYAGENTAIEDYMVWLSTSLPVAHTDTIEDMKRDLNLLAERRPQRPLFVPIHTPRSYFRYSDLAKLMRQLDSNTFEALDGSSFNAMFAKSRSNTIGVNLPEFFIPDPITLNNGRLNKVFIRLQNFSTEKATAELQRIVTCDAWDSPMKSSESIELKGKEQTEIGMNVGLRNRSGKGQGKLEYIMNGETVISVPVTFVDPA